MEKLRENKEILGDPAFREQYEGIQVQNLLFDIIEEILWIVKSGSQNVINIAFRSTPV